MLALPAETPSFLLLAAVLRQRLDSGLCYLSNLFFLHLFLECSRGASLVAHSRFGLPKGKSWFEELKEPTFFALKIPSSQPPGRGPERGNIRFVQAGMVVLSMDSRPRSVGW